MRSTMWILVWVYLMLTVGLCTWQARQDHAAMRTLAKENYFLRSALNETGRTNLEIDQWLGKMMH